MKSKQCESTPQYILEMLAATDDELSAVASDLLSLAASVQSGATLVSSVCGELEQ